MQPLPQSGGTTVDAQLYPYKYFISNSLETAWRVYIPSAEPGKSIDCSLPRQVSCVGTLMRIRFVPEAHYCEKPRNEDYLGIDKVVFPLQKIQVTAEFAAAARQLAELNKAFTEQKEKVETLAWSIPELMKDPKDIKPI